ncbi:MAG: membrane protein insertion efficiency factor YidD [Chlamydiia bacterium]|nr:membrane protein insertion efficiency factor YidD [Chlamydiia bacterium]
MRWLCLPLCFLACTGYGEEPWGRDADLVEPRCAASCEERCTTLPQALIRGYQCFISPSNGPRSSYVPSSSQYTLEAMRAHGFFWGWLCGCDRLMRENEDPWIYGRCINHEGFDLKWDPIP